jgi:hypothetical protein
MKEQKDNEKHHYALMQIGWKSDNLVAFGMFWFDNDGKLIHHKLDLDLAKKVCETFIGKGVYETLKLESYESAEGKKELYEKLTLRYWNQLQKENKSAVRYSKSAHCSVPKYSEPLFNQLWNLVI